jgi:hypothetical protein
MESYDIHPNRSLSSPNLRMDLETLRRNSQALRRVNPENNVLGHSWEGLYSVPLREEHRTTIDHFCVQFLPSVDFDRLETLLGATQTLLN